jgi:hypothetical protein
MVVQRENHEHLREKPEIGGEAQNLGKSMYGRGIPAKAVEDDVQERDHKQHLDQNDAKRE